MKPAHQSAEALLAEIDRHRAGADDTLAVWWLGQAGFLVQHRDTRLLIDPYLSDSLTAKYATTDTPHVRMTERVIAPDRLTGIGLVTSSHNHTDHLDHETLWPLLHANPQAALVVPEANRDFAHERLRHDPVWQMRGRDWPTGIDDGQTTTVAGCSVTGLAVAHEELDTDGHGRHHHLGYLFAIGPWTLFHSGDAVPYTAMASKLLALLAGRPLDVCLLPINGRRPERRVPGNFWGDEAATFAHEVGAGVVIPMHYDMFEFNTQTPELFVATCERLGQRYAVLHNGEGWTTAALRGETTFKESTR